MAIAPIINANMTTKNLSFQGRKEKHQETYSQDSNKAGAMVTVPVAVLMALATTSLNAKPAEANDPLDNSVQTELVAQNASEIQAPQQSSQSTPQKNTECKDIIAWFKSENRFLQSFELVNAQTSLPTEKRKSYSLVLTRDPKLSQGKYDKVRLIPYDAKSSDWSRYEVIGMAHHKGQGKDYYGAFVQDWTADRLFEVKLTKESAAKLLKIIEGSTLFQNNTSLVGCCEIKAPNLLKESTIMACQIRFPDKFYQPTM